MTSRSIRRNRTTMEKIGIVTTSLVVVASVCVAVLTARSLGEARRYLRIRNM
jgi:hypothetical protein